MQRDIHPPHKSDLFGFIMCIVAIISDSTGSVLLMEGPYLVVANHLSLVVNISIVNQGFRVFQKITGVEMVVTMARFF